MTCLELYRLHFPDLAASLEEEREDFRGPCPACSRSHNRFVLWKNSEGFFCRNQNGCDKAGGRCKGQGSVIDFCQVFLGMTFEEAVRMKENSSFRKANHNSEQQKQNQTEQKMGIVNREEWSERAGRYMKIWQQDNLTKPSAKELLKERGITVETALKANMGYVQVTRKDYEAKQWGFEVNEKFTIPAGLIMAASKDKKIVELEVRCSPDFIFYQGTPREMGVKHFVVKGSEISPFVYKGTGIAVAVFESALDAILAWQASDYKMTCIALGGVERNFNAETIDFVRRHEIRISCFDHDDAGVAAFVKWNQAVSFSAIVPFYGQKDLCDMQRKHDMGEEYPDSKQWYRYDILPVITGKVA